MPPYRPIWGGGWNRGLARGYTREVGHQVTKIVQGGENLVFMLLGGATVGHASSTWRGLNFHVENL